MREDAGGPRLGEEWLDRLGRGELHATIEEPFGATVKDELACLRDARWTTARDPEIAAVLRAHGAAIAARDRAP